MAYHTLEAAYKEIEDEQHSHDVIDGGFTIYILVPADSLLSRDNAGNIDWFMEVHNILFCSRRTRIGNYTLVNTLCLSGQFSNLEMGTAGVLQIACNILTYTEPDQTL